MCIYTRVYIYTCACLVTQSYLTLCNPIHCSLPGYSVPVHSRKEYQSGLPFPYPGDLPNPGIKPGSPALQVDSLPSEKPGKPPHRPTHTLNEILCACVLSCFSCVWLFATLWTVARQAPLSKEFSRQECWSVLPRTPPGHLPNPGSNLCCLHYRWILHCWATRKDPVE